MSGLPAGLGWAALGGLLLLGLLGSAARLAGQAALIRLAGRTPGQSFWAVWKGRRGAWRLGWTRSLWRLWLLQAAGGLALAPLVLGCLAPALLLVGPDGLRGEVAPAARMAAAGLAALLILSLLYLPLSLAGGLLQLARRAIVLDGAGVVAGLGRAWGLALRRGQEVFSLWVTLLALELGYYLVALPLAAGLAVAGMLVGWAAGAAVYLALEGRLALEAGFGLAALAGLGVMFVIAGLPMMLVDGLWSTYVSLAWTRVYVELSAQEAA